MSAKTIEFKDHGMRNLVRAFKDNKKISVRVGVLAGNTQRTKTKKSNAEIGYKHEFGIGVPRRSFLRMPLIEHLQKYLDKSGAFDKAAVRQVIKDGSFVPWYEKVAIVAERVVADAFNTGGFGKWKPSNMRNKKNHQTLVETQQLRDSITSEVKK